MSEERKPFAEVVRSDLHGRPVLSWPGGSFDPDGWLARMAADEASLRNAARRISEAVEQRERTLRAALAEAQLALKWASDDLANAYLTTITPEMPIAKALAAVAAALGPNPPRYVPLADLEAERAKVKQLQAGVDAIDTTHADDFSSEDEKLKAVQRVEQFLEANGLKKPKPMSDEDLLAELNKRRKLTDRIVAAGMRGAARAARDRDGDAAITARGLMRIADALDPTDGPGPSSPRHMAADDPSRWDPLQWPVLRETPHGYLFAGPRGDTIEIHDMNLGRARDELRLQLATVAESARATIPVTLMLIVPAESAAVAAPPAAPAPPATP